MRGIYTFKIDYKTIALKLMMLRRLVKGLSLMNKVVMKRNVLIINSSKPSNTGGI